MKPHQTCTPGLLALKSAPDHVLATRPHAQYVTPRVQNRPETCSTSPPVNVYVGIRDSRQQPLIEGPESGQMAPATVSSGRREGAPRRPFHREQSSDVGDMKTKRLSELELLLVLREQPMPRDRHDSHATPLPSS